MSNFIKTFLDLIKKPLYLFIFIGAILLLCVVATITVRTFAKPEKLVDTNTGQVKITQAYVSISAYGESTTNSDYPDMAVLQYSPLVNFSTKKDMKKFEIKNVKLTNTLKGDRSFITWPKHFEQGKDNNRFYEALGVKADLLNRDDEGNSFEYKVVDTAKYTDEISKTGGFVDFRYTIYGLGNPVDYNGIMNSQNVYSSGKELQYAGLKKGDINSPIEFDVVITFVDGTKAIKHFSLTSNFDEIYDQGFSFQYNSSDYEGKEF